MAQELPEIKGSENNREGLTSKFQDRVGSMKGKAQGASAVALGSDPIVAGAAGIVSGAIFSGLSQVGKIADTFRQKVTSGGKTDSVDLNVDGKIEVLGGDGEKKSVERVKEAQGDDQEESTPVSEAGRIERLLGKSSEKVDGAGNTAAGGTAMLFGSDPIVAAGMAGLAKLGSKLGSKALGTGAGLLENRRNKKSPRKKVREKMIENRKTKSMRKRMAINDSDVIASASTAALEKMPSQDDSDTIVGQSLPEMDIKLDSLVEKMTPLESLGEMNDSVKRIEEYLGDGLPDAQDRAEDKNLQRKEMSQQEDTQKLLEEISENTAEKEKKGLLGSLGGLFEGGVGGGLMRGGIGGLVGAMFGSMIRMVPRLLFQAVKKFPLVGFVASIFTGLFDGVKHYIEGGSIMGAIFKTIEGFADSVVRIFTFGLVNIEKLRDWTQPIFDSIFDAVFAIGDIISSGWDLLTESIQGIFDQLSYVFTSTMDFVNSIPDMMMSIVPDWAKRFLGVGEEGEIAENERASRLQNQNRERIQQTLEQGYESGPMGRRMELTEERRAQLEERLRVIESKERREANNRAVLQEQADVAMERAGYDRYTGDSFEVPEPKVEEDKEVLPGREVERTRLEREQAADSFERGSIELELEPMRQQARESQRMSNQINNVVQTNNNQSNIINYPGRLRKEDYFSGASNREVDWR